MIKNKANIKIIRFKRKVKNCISKYKNKIILFFLLVLFFYLLIFFYNKTINNKNNLITDIYFDKNIVHNPNLLKLTNFTSLTLSGVNTVKNKILKYKTQKEKIIHKFPFVKSLTIKEINKKSVNVSFKFKQPKLIFIGSGYIFAVYNKDNYIYKFNAKFLTGLNIVSNVNIYLPSYIKTNNNLNKIFWKTKSSTLIRYVNGIKKVFPKGKIFYIVGGENLKVLADNKTIYFSVNKDITKQVYQIKLLKKQKQNLYKKATVIDVGNLDEGIYIKQGK